MLFIVVPLLSLFLDNLQGYRGGALIKCRPKERIFKMMKKNKKKVVEMKSGTWMVINN
jgi:hypothetical protein